MKLGELHPLAKGIIITLVILFVIYIITVVASFSVRSELNPGYPYS